jgi:hypothetical protein
MRVGMSVLPNEPIIKDHSENEFLKVPDPKKYAAQTGRKR